MLHGTRVASDGAGSLLDLQLGSSPHSAAPDLITVPDAHLLFSGEYKRSGSFDLKIVGEDGKSFLIPDYFKTDKRATLKSPEGATLTADIVEALAGPLAPGQYAQAAQTPGGAEVIGRVATVSGNATVLRNGVTVTLNAGDAIQKGDVVQTGSGTNLGIAFNDGSTFSLTANARMVINEFVFEQGGANNASLMTLVQGAAHFVAGQVAKTGDMKVATPVATMGIRGTAVILDASAVDGRVSVSVIDQRDGQNHSVQIFGIAPPGSPPGTLGPLIATAVSNGGTWILTPTASLQVIAQEVGKNVQQIAFEFAAFQALLNTYDAAKQYFPQGLPEHTDIQPRTQHAEGTQIQPSPTGGGLPKTTDGEKVTIVLTDNRTGGGPGDNNGDIIDVDDDDDGVAVEVFVQTTNIITGTDGNDDDIDNPVLVGTDGNDWVLAGDGDDIIIAGHGGGDDLYDGQGGDDTIKFESAILGVTIELNEVAGILLAKADGPTTGHDQIINVEKFVTGPGRDVFILKTDTHWELDAGAGIDTIRLFGDLDIRHDNGPDVENFEIIDLNTTGSNIVDIDAQGVAEMNAAHTIRVLGNSDDHINVTSDFSGQFGLGLLGLLAGFANGHWELAANDVLYTADNATLGIVFDKYEFVTNSQEPVVLATAYVQDGIVIDVIENVTVTMQQPYDFTRLDQDLANTQAYGPFEEEGGADYFVLSKPGIAFKVFADGIDINQQSPLDIHGTIYRIEIWQSDYDGEGDFQLEDMTARIGSADGFDIDAQDLSAAINQLSNGGNSTLLDAIFAAVSYFALGSTGADVLLGGEFQDRLKGNAGDDTLTGNGGEDIFVYTSGSDTVTDFSIQQGDRIDLTAFSNLRSIGDPADIGFSPPQQDGLDTIIGFGDGNVLRLKNVDVDDLTDEHFIFAKGAAFEDRFNSQVPAYNLNDGSKNWATNWTETDDDYSGAENGSPTEGDIFVSHDPVASQGNLQLTLTDTDAEGDVADTIQRSVDLSGASSATLTFDYRRVGLEDGDDDAIQIYASNGGTFQLIGEIEGNGQDDQTYQTFSADLTSFISGTTTIRFAVGDDLEDGDTLYIDNVRIAYEPAEGDGVPPVANNDIVDTTEDHATIDIHVAQNDSDNQQVSLVAANISALSNPALGTLQYISFGDFTFTPAANAFGTTTFTYQAFDGQSYSNTATVTINVAPVNDAPPVINVFGDDGDTDSVTISETNAPPNETGTLTVTDVDPDQVTVTVTGIDTDGPLGQHSEDDFDGFLSVPPAPLASGQQFTWSFAPNNEAFNYLAAGESLILHYFIQAGDGQQAFDDHVINITINGSNDAPVLDEDQTPVLASVNEDAGAPVGQAGTLISQLVDLDAPAGGLDNVTDADSAVTGIAIYGTNTAHGTWFYTTDGGSIWQPVGSVSDSAALLLAADANTRLYFQPNPDFNGTISEAIMFRAWDRSAGTNGQTFDIGAGGANTTSVSGAPDTAAITVNAANNAPVANNETLNDNIAGYSYNSANGHWYIVNDTPLGWDDAVLFGGLFGGGYLASITSAEENAFVANLLNPLAGAPAWLGGSDSENEGDWRWVFGPEADQQFWLGDTSGAAPAGAYENWLRSLEFPTDYVEPNGGTGENVVYMLSTGEWVDYPGAGTGGSAEPLASVLEVSIVEDVDSYIPRMFLLANDNAGQNPSINLVSGTSAGGGTVTVDLGFVQYRSAENFSGTDSFTYTVTDENGTSNVATVTFNVIAVNDAPVLSDLDSTVSSEEQVFAHLDTDVTVSDAELDALIGGSGDYNGAQLTVARQGGACAEDEFSFSFQQASSLSLDGNTIKTAGNTIPVASFSVIAGVLTIDFFRPGGDLRFLVNEVMQGITYRNASDTPPANITLDYTFSDGNTGDQGAGGAGEVTHSITVNITDTPDEPTNQPPVATDDDLNGGIAGFSYIPATGHWYKINEDILSWSEAHDAAELAGGYLVTVTSSDESNFLSTFLDNSFPGEALPWAGASDAAVEEEWRWLTGPEAGQLFWLGDVDGFAQNGAYENWNYVTVDDVKIYIEPNDEFGAEDYLGLWVNNQGDTWNDDEGENGNASVIEVSIVEDVNSTIPAAFLLANDTDAEFETLSISGLGNGNATSAATDQGGTVELLENGNILYRSAENYNGPDSFTYFVRDESGAVSNEATVTFNVQAINDAPTLEDGTLEAVAEDTFDPDGQTVAVIFENKFSDVDDDDFDGIAIAGNSANPSEGTWQFSCDYGNSWQAVGEVSETEALVLDTHAKLRFLPVENFNGTPGSLVVYGLDETYTGQFSYGSQTITINVAVRGGSTPISEEAANVDTSITPEAGSLYSAAFTTFDVDGASSTMVLGINDFVNGLNGFGEIVGQYVSDRAYGFYSDFDGPVTIEHGGSLANTSADSINNSLQIVGFYEPVPSTPRYGFVYESGDFTSPVIHPGSTGSTTLDGINDAGLAVGSVWRGGNSFSAFTWDGDTFTTFDVPGAAFSTRAGDINNQGHIVGFYDNLHGYLYKPNDTVTEDDFTILDHPLAAFGTFAVGVNESDEVVGWYIDAAGDEHGFLWSGDNYSTIDNPLGVNGTWISDINNRSEISGWYADGSNVNHGFVADLVFNGPLIYTVNADTSEFEGSTTLFNLTLTDADGGPNDLYDVTVIAQDDNATLSMANSEFNIGDVDGTSNGMSFTRATLQDINIALEDGITYNPADEPESPLERVSLYIEDQYGASDTVNFIFNVEGTQGVELEGTDGKDLIFGTGWNDTFTGGAGADTFIFSARDFPPMDDTITDFVQGQDKIALYDMFSSFNEMQSAGAFSGNQIDLGVGVGTITLDNVVVTSLTANDFIFHPGLQ